MMAAEMKVLMSISVGLKVEDDQASKEKQRLSLNLRSLQGKEKSKRNIATDQALAKSFWINSTWIVAH